MFKVNQSDIIICLVLFAEEFELVQMSSPVFIGRPCEPQILVVVVKNELQRLPLDLSLSLFS